MWWLTVVLLGASLLPCWHLLSFVVPSHKLLLPECAFLSSYEYPNHWKLLSKLHLLASLLNQCIYAAKDSFSFC